MPTPPKKTAKKTTAKKVAKATAKKVAAKKGDRLAADVAYRMLSSDLTASESLIMPETVEVRAWFTSTLGTLERSAGKDAPLTLDFSKVLTEALEQVSDTKFDGNRRYVLGTAVKAASLYLKHHVRSLKEESRAV